jgi:hypothetical protein
MSPDLGTPVSVFGTWPLGMLLACRRWQRVAFFLRSR